MKRTRGSLAVGLLGALIVILFTASLETYPAPSCDETGYGASAFALSEQGRVNWSSLLPAGDPYGRDVNMVAHGRLYAFGLAATFQIFGLSLRTARLFSLLGWASAVWLTYRIGARYDRTVGLGAALLFATTTKSLLTAHTARPETWTTAAVLLATLAALRLAHAARPGLPLCALTGALAVLPGDVHGNGFAFTLGIGTALCVELGLGQRRWRALLAVGLGAALAALAWAALHLGSDLSKFRQLLEYAALPRADADTGLAASLAALVEWFRLSFWVAGGPISLIELTLAILGCGLAFVRRRAVDRVLLLIALAALAAFGAFYTQRFVQYALLWSPFWFVLGVAGLAEIARRLAARWPDRRPLLRAALLLALGGVFAVQLAGDLWLINRFRGGRYEQTFARLRALVPASSRVVADTTWWWALQDRRAFLADEYFLLLNQTDDPDVRDFLALRGPASPTEALPALLRRLRPDYVVMDRATGCFMGPGTEWETLSAYVREQCRVVGEVAGAWVDDPGRRTSQFGQVSTVYLCRVE